MHAHIKSTLVGSTQMLVIEDGQLMLEHGSASFSLSLTGRGSAEKGKALEHR